MLSNTYHPSSNECPVPPIVCSWSASFCSRTSSNTRLWDFPSTTRHSTIFSSFLTKTTMPSFLYWLAWLLFSLHLGTSGCGSGRHGRHDGSMGPEGVDVWPGWRWRYWWLRPASPYAPSCPYMTRYLEGSLIHGMVIWIYLEVEVGLLLSWYSRWQWLAFPFLPLCPHLWPFWILNMISV